MSYRDTIDGLSKAMASANAAIEAAKKAREAQERIVYLKGPKGDRGDTGPRGPKGDFVVGPRGPKGDPGRTPVKGVDYFDGKDGLDGDPEEFRGIATQEVQQHAQAFKHELIHDPKILGTKEVDESTLGTDKFLKYDGEKLVYAEMPKQQAQVFYGGGSSLSDYYRVNTVTSDATIDPEWRITHVDASAGNITLTIHTAEGHNRRSHILKRIDSTENIVTIQMTGSETLDGQTTDQLPNAYSARHIYSDGSNWFLLHA